MLTWQVWVRGNKSSHCLWNQTALVQISVPSLPVGELGQVTNLSKPVSLSRKCRWILKTVKINGTITEKALIQDLDII